MKKPNRIAVLVALTAAFSSACGVHSIKPYRSEAPVLDRSELSTLTVLVVGDVEHEVDRGVGFLSRTGLFRDVVTTRSIEPNLVARVIEPAPTLTRCGTPDIMFMVFTLGLGLIRDQHTETLNLEFTGPTSVERVRFDSEFSAESRTGLWAFPMRISRKWRKPDKGDPVNLSALLKEQLLARQRELVALARVSPQGSAQSALSNMPLDLTVTTLAFASVAPAGQRRR